MNIKSLLAAGCLASLCACTDPAGPPAPERPTDSKVLLVRNPVFDLPHWLSRCELTTRNDVYYGEIITGPADICANEHLRSCLQDVYRWGEGIPMDVFVMADGEPEQRGVTKLGGLPYRPADEPWPQNAQGNPLLFVAQMNFADSTDLVGKLPADLLLVFADWQEGRIEDVHFEWQPWTRSELIDAGSIPAHPGTFAGCYGTRLRTMNFPAAEQVDSSPHAQCHGRDVHGDYLVPAYQATQIGRSPFWLQGVEEDLPGEVICTISSVQPQPDAAHPWVNRAAPVPLLSVSDDEHWRIADMGCLYISLDETGQLHWRLQSY